MSSFFDLDHIIGLNERRQQEYLEAYHKTQDKFTYLIVFYSIEAVFLVPIIQSLFFSGANCNWLFHLSFYLYAALLSISFAYSIRLLTPLHISLLDVPERFYLGYRRQYEEMGFDQQEIDKRLKLSYLDELKYAVGDNRHILKRKMHFFLCAYLFSVIALVPYIACVTFQLNLKEDVVHKIEIVKTPKQ